MRRLFAVAVGLLVVVGVAAPAGAAVPGVGVVSANEYVNGACSLGTNARVFKASLAGTYPVGNSAALGALSFHAFHSCTDVLGAITLTGETMPGTAAVAASCTGGKLTRTGSVGISISAACVAGSQHFRISLITVRDALSSINSFTISHGLIGLPNYLGAYTITAG